jgi:HSP20 family protein
VAGRGMRRRRALPLLLTRPGAPVQADGAEMIVAERPYGTFTRQVFLGETLDADHIDADYAPGVLTLTIPVHEAAKPRSIHVTSSDQKQAVTA